MIEAWCPQCLVTYNPDSIEDLQHAECGTFPSDWGVWGDLGMTDEEIATAWEKAKGTDQTSSC